MKDSHPGKSSGAYKFLKVQEFFLKSSFLIFTTKISFANNSRYTLYTVRKIRDSSAHVTVFVCFAGLRMICSYETGRNNNTLCYLSEQSSYINIRTQVRCNNTAQDRYDYVRIMQLYVLREYYVLRLVSRVCM